MLARIFGTKNNRELKRMGKIVAQINKLEPEFEALSDEELAATTPRLRERLDEGLFYVLFDTPDRIQHMFWRYRDPTHPAHGVRVPRSRVRRR